jgi:hypothetical protein
MPAPAGSTVPAILSRAADSLEARLLGIVVSPRATLETVVARPQWAVVLVLTFIVTTVSSALLLETDVGQLALVDQWERTALAFGYDIDDAAYAAMVEASRNGTAYAVVSSFMSGPLLACAMAALLFCVFTVARHGTATYRQVFAVVVHAGVILALRQVIAAPVSYARETLASPAAMTMFFTMLNEGSPVARFVAMIDLFMIWWILVVALGVSVLYRRSARTVPIVFIGAYIALAFVLAIVMAVTGGTA